MRKSVITYRGACEGLQEKLYFMHLQNLINNGDYNYRINFILKNVSGGSPSKIVNQARIYSVEGDENHRVAVFDCDFQEEDLEKSLRIAKEKKIIPAFSNVNFNLFLILHKKMFSSQVNNTSGYDKTLRNVFNLSKDEDIKSKNIITKKILKHIGIEDVLVAIKNSKRLKNDKSFNQPYTALGEFLEKVFKEIGIITVKKSKNK